LLQLSLNIFDRQVIRDSRNLVTMEEQVDYKSSLSITDSTATKLLGLLLLITAYLGVQCITFIPPWQSPDEPTHFEYAQVLSSGGNPFHPRPELGLQKRIIQSLDRFQYWHYVGVETPDPLPEIFTEAPFVKDAASQLLKNPPVYYLIASVFLRLNKEETILGGLYQLRVLSLVFTLLTVIVVFAVAREFAPGQSLFHLATATFAAFLPQFMVIGTSVSPDPLINLMGSLVVWGTLKASRPGSSPYLSGLVIFLMIVGFTVSYKFFMILPVLIFWLPVVIFTETSRRILWFKLILVGLVILAFVVIYIYLFPFRMTRLYPYRLNRMLVPLKEFIACPSSSPPGHWRWFYWEIFKSTWLKFGHLRYELPIMVYYILHIVTLIAVLGVVWTVVKKIAKKRSESFRLSSLIVTIAFALSVLVTYYCVWGPRFGATTTQGRHFFIVLPAGAILIVLGWGAFFPRRWRNLSYIIFMAGMLSLVLLAIFGYIRPTFF